MAGSPAVPRAIRRAWCRDPRPGGRQDGAMHVRRPAWAGTGAALLLVAACSAAPETTPAARVPAAGGSAAVLVHDVDADPGTRPALRSRITRIAGELSDVRRERVARQARAAVQDYLEAAFTDDGRRPFRRFQPGLRGAARADRRV